MGGAEMAEIKKRDGVAKGIFWKLLERFGVQGAQFLIQLVLARLLEPSHYGTMAVMTVFISLAGVLVQGGFYTALIQKKDVEERDFSAALWTSLSAAGVLYGVLFCAAPGIGVLCTVPEIAAPLRLLALVLFPNAMQSILLAAAGRCMQFKWVFCSSLTAVLLSGAVCIALAYGGAGLWTLVAQSLLNSVLSCVLLCLLLRWRPKLSCELRRVRALFAFGWKLLVSGLLDTAYQQLHSFAVGQKFSPEILGFYSRGRQLPQFFAYGVGDSLQSVLLPVLSAEQADPPAVRARTRQAVSLSAYLVFPVMAMLAGAAEPLVRLLLTEKWTPCTAFLRIFCLSLALYPVHVCHLQAVNAMGRSDIFLRLELVKKGIGTAALLAAVLCFDSAAAVAWTSAVTAVVGCAVNGCPNRKLIGYSHREQAADILPPALLAVLAYGAVRLTERLALPPLLSLLLQLAAGAALYFGLSAVLRIRPYRMLLSMLKGEK